LYGDTENRTGISETKISPVLTRTTLISPNNIPQKENSTKTPKKSPKEKKKEKNNVNLNGFNSEKRTGISKTKSGFQKTKNLENRKGIPMTKMIRQRPYTPDHPSFPH